MYNTQHLMPMYSYSCAGPPGHYIIDDLIPFHQHAGKYFWYFKNLYQVTGRGRTEGLRVNFNTVSNAGLHCVELRMGKGHWYCCRWMTIKTYSQKKSAIEKDYAQPRLARLKSGTESGALLAGTVFHSQCWQTGDNGMPLHQQHSSPGVFLRRLFSRDDLQSPIGYARQSAACIMGTKTRIPGTEAAYRMQPRLARLKSGTESGALLAGTVFHSQCWQTGDNGMPLHQQHSSPGRDQGKAICLPPVWVVDVRQAIHEDGLRTGIATELEIAKGTDLDGDIYDHVKDYLISFSRTELETCQSVHNTFQFLLETSSRVMQDFNQQLFLQENPVFHKAQVFHFQPSDSDMSLNAVQLVDIEPSPVSAMRMTLSESRQLESETGTTEEHSLNKEARKWATRVAREHKNIIHNQRALEECDTHGVVPTEQSRIELEQKVEEAKENIRKAETVKLKAEARLDLLRQIGVSVDTWLKSAMNQVMEELENERWASLPTLSNNDSSLSMGADEREEGEEFEDNMDVFDDSSSSPSGTLRNYPLTCKVLYSYRASQPDELTIEEQEVLEVIEDGDMEDWVKAKNKGGHVGYVPEKYLQFPTSNSLLSMLQSLAALDARSHTSSNSTEPELASGSMNGDASEHNSFSSDCPGFSQLPRFTPDSARGKLRPVRAAPPPPTQHPRRQAEKTEEVEITLV
ncbi:UNVERIFIED_CONTAM: hypothetical protein FKN15_067471 [Acipenser sinensis]